MNAIGIKRISDRGIVSLFAGFAALHALIQIFCLGTGALGFTFGRPVYIAALVICIILSALFALRFKSPSTPTTDETSTLFVRVTTLFFKILFGCSIIWFLWIYVRMWQLVALKNPLDWDGLYYHLPAIQGWVAAGRVCWLDQIPDLPFSNGYAMGNEVVTYFMYRILGHMDLVDGGNLWYWPLGFFALAEIADRIGVKGFWRWVTGALLIGAPVIVSQSATCYVDIGFTFTTMAALAAGLIVVFDEEGGKWPALVLFGACLGLMAGTKGTGAPFAVVIMALVLGGRILRNGRETSEIWVCRMFCAGLVVLAVGGYWYIRNIIHTGNPVFPIQVKLGAKVLFDGYNMTLMQEPNQPAWLVEFPNWLRPFVIWLQLDYPITGPGPMGGLGFIWLLGCVPAIIFLALRHLFRWFKERSMETFLSPLMLLIMMAGALYVISPIKWWARFLLWLLALGLPCLMLVLQMSMRNLKYRIWPLMFLWLGLGLTGVAGWEAYQAYEAERNLGLIRTGEESSYVTSMEYRIYGMKDVPGIDRFMAAPIIARTYWGTVGTFMGGILSQPLDARKIYFISLEPTEQELDDLLAKGVEWIVWDCINILPLDRTEHSKVPQIILDRALEDIEFILPPESDFHFLRMR
ncbi:MAG: hypothetical protein GY835_10440 [bacterium]|nr:hypothetical protein [bacterium]